MAATQRAVHIPDVAEDVVAVVRAGKVSEDLRADMADFLVHTNYLGLLKVASLFLLCGQER